MTPVHNHVTGIACVVLRGRNYREIDPRLSIHINSIPPFIAEMTGIPMLWCSMRPNRKKYSRVRELFATTGAVRRA